MIAASKIQEMTFLMYSCYYASREDIWVSGGTAPCTLNLSSNSSEMLHLQGTSPQNPLNRGVRDDNLTTSITKSK
jgi:hypothetical protein